MVLVFRLLLVFLATLSLSGCQQKVADTPVIISSDTNLYVGHHVKYFQEHDATLTLQQAIEYFSNHPVSQGSSQSIALGIGTRPAWLHFQIENSSDRPMPMRLAIETPWLDRIDTYLVNHSDNTAHIAGGDYYPFEQRPMPYRVYAFERNFSAGLTDVYIRVESLGPMALPIKLSTPERAIKDDIATGYQYGILYGIMLALALYNLVLFVIIRHREFGLYSLYLIGFVLNSLSYTGQLHAVFTPDYGPYFQDWMDNFLMMTYSIAGLHFARTLLNTADYAPLLDKITRYITLVIPVGVALGFIADQLVFSLLLAFILNSGFATLFIAMGIAAKKANVPSANLFLISSVTAATCIGISTMAVAGIVPYNTYTFKAIEVGMAFEAIMLSVVLATLFRMTKRDLSVAEKVARTDPLTNINNRRGFEILANAAFIDCMANDQELSVAIIDIDRFKRINDNFGHATGDEVIRQVAQTLRTTVRKSDLVARWGGEEFILLLPGTRQSEALNHAERVRNAIEKLAVLHNSASVNFTVSIGLIGSENGLIAGKPIIESSLEWIISLADNALYDAKQSGRNQVAIQQA